MKFSLRNISNNLVRDGFRPQIYCHYREDIFFFSSRGILTYLYLFQHDWRLYKISRNTTCCKIWSFKANFFKAAINDNVNNPRIYWDHLNTLIKGKNVQQHIPLQVGWGTYFEYYARVLLKGFFRVESTGKQKSYNYFWCSDKNLVHVSAEASYINKRHVN